MYLKTVTFYCLLGCFSLLSAGYSYAQADPTMDTLSGAYTPKALGNTIDEQIRDYYFKINCQPKGLEKPQEYLRDNPWPVYGFRTYAIHFADLMERSIKRRYHEKYGHLISPPIKKKMIWRILYKKRTMEI